jgi:hypothetical protein
MKYKIHKLDDEGWTDWFAPETIGYRIECCDCGLVHAIDFRLKDQEIEMRTRRLVNATVAARRRQK